ncbi:MAG TPA: hypothetical protein VFT59_00890 [Candidatus Saccharimonadales bacterium]|nr:hypothetical protein [Candidatus Saccharimonadales bacterium]
MVKLEPRQRIQFHSLAEGAGASMAIRQDPEPRIMYIVEGDQVFVDAFEHDIQRMLGMENYSRYNRPLPGFPLGRDHVFPVTMTTWQAHY